MIGIKLKDSDLSNLRRAVEETVGPFYINPAILLALIEEGQAHRALRAADDIPPYSGPRFTVQAMTEDDLWDVRDTDNLSEARREARELQAANPRTGYRIYDHQNPSPIVQNYPPSERVVVVDLHVAPMPLPDPVSVVCPDCGHAFPKNQTEHYCMGLMTGGRVFGLRTIPA